MTEEAQISSRIRLSPAERMVLIEQIEGLKLSSGLLRNAVESGMVSDLGTHWVQMGEAMNYIGSILNMKGNIAARQFLFEQMKGD